MENEVWKSVVGYEGLYDVSSHGRVKSLQRTVIDRRIQRGIKERILKSVLAKGYPLVVLCKGGIRKAFKVHILVSTSFLGHTPISQAFVVDHINGIKTDNRVDNLRIVTNRFNVSASILSSNKKCSSKFIGVSWQKSVNKWQANIEISGRKKYLGVFTNEIDASVAYQKALASL